MIRYALSCSEGHEFEAWFGSSEAFDRQAEAKEVRCPMCGDSHVEKLPMAPNVARRRSDASVRRSEAPVQKNDERRKTYAMLREIRDKLTANSDYVGPRFPEEARKIHYQEVPPRGIHGEASVDEARLLEEEGISLWPLPPLPEDGN